jgi:predicted nucleic acid-binding protein
MIQLASEAAHQLAICAVSQVEFQSAVRRRQRAGDLPADLVDLAVERFETHLKSRFLRQAVSDRVIDLASDLTARHSLRAYDAVQLAGCLTLKAVSQESPVFVCADGGLLEAAESEYLVTLDPAH